MMPRRVAVSPSATFASVPSPSMRHTTCVQPTTWPFTSRATCTAMCLGGKDLGLSCRFACWGRWCLSLYGPSQWSQWYWTVRGHPMRTVCLISFLFGWSSNNVRFFVCIVLLKNSWTQFFFSQVVSDWNGTSPLLYEQCKLGFGNALRDEFTTWSCSKRKR